MRIEESVQNTRATGVPTISGTVRVEETLTSAATAAVVGTGAADGPVWSADMVLVDYENGNIGAGPGQTPRTAIR